MLPLNHSAGDNSAGFVSHFATPTTTTTTTGSNSLLKNNENAEREDDWSDEEGEQGLLHTQQADTEVSKLLRLALLQFQNKGGGM
jgi:hypothetical protein